MGLDGLGLGLEISVGTDSKSTALRCWKVKWHKILGPEVEISLKFFFFKNLPAAHWLHLPDDVKFQIDDALSQFEAGDFQVYIIISYLIILYHILSYLCDQEYCDDFYDLPREFNILGSCLFHKVQSYIKTSTQIISCDISYQTCHFFSYLMIPYMTYHVSFTLIARASSIRFPYFVFLLSWHNNRMSNVTQPNLVFIHLLPSIWVVIYSIELT